jgi:4-hydroxyphenylpyruvate dioxygenase-like putative hemolysin
MIVAIVTNSAVRRLVMSEVYENPMGTDGFEFVEYAAPDRKT